MNSDFDYRALILATLLGLAFFLMFIMQSCTTTKVVTEYRDSVVYKAYHDTTIIKQTDSVERWRSADTVYLTRWRLKEIEKIKHDTISEAQIVKEPYEVVVTKDKVPAWCWWLLAANVVFVGYKVGRIALKIYTQGRV